MSEDRVLRLPTGELISIIRTGHETEGEVFEFESVLPSGLSGPPAHWHRGRAGDVRSCRGQAPRASWARRARSRTRRIGSCGARNRARVLQSGR
jgi:hypothetical protein